MSNPRQSPVPNPRKFIGSVFDLAYGKHDGSEKVSDAEIEVGLREAGIDPEAAWKEFTKILQAEPKRESLADVRRRRLAVTPPSIVSMVKRARTAILAEIDGLLVGEPAGVFGRKWAQSTDEDLEILCDQLRRQKERSKTDEPRS